jgi:hypothetical protein
MDIDFMRDEILKTTYFMPAQIGMFNIDIISNYLVIYDEDEIRIAFEELANERMVEPVERADDGEILWRSTEPGWRAREALIRARGGRHPALANQGDHQLQDLIVAIAMSGLISHSSAGGGYLPPDEVTSVAELLVYLPFFSEHQIREACQQLCEQSFADYGILQRRELGFTGIKMTPRGERAYKAEIRTRLGIDNGGWILQENKRERIVIFFAWQSDYGTSRNHLTTALQELKISSELWNLTNPLDVEVAVEPHDGALRIDASLQQKIMSCDVFVGDLTPVFRFCGRLNPNPNILIETGYALAALDPRRIVLVEHHRDLHNIPGEGFGDLPFDIRQVHRIRYTMPKDLRTGLSTHVRARLVALGLAKPQP